MSFYDREIIDPSVSLFSECRYCGNLFPIKIENEKLIIDERKCPHCEIFLEEHDILNGLIKSFSYTQAYLSAQKITSFDLAVIPFVCVNLLTVWVKFPAWFIIPFALIPYISPVFFCIKWFQKHYWHNHLADEEYNFTVKELKKSLILWVFANIFCWTLLFF